MGLCVAVALMAGAATTSNAQIIVKVRPPRPAVVVARPPAPGPGYVWVEEDWVGRGNNYDWHGGYWAAPPRAGNHWVPGHWVQRRRGWVWMPGHWTSRGRRF
jgi:hypothetical protein